MIEIPDPNPEIPDQLKVHNGLLHRLALSDDPAIKCLNVGNLVRNIRATMTLGRLMDYEFVDPYFGFKTTLDKFLEYHYMGANKAWNDYATGKTGSAVEKAGAVLNAILFIIYDDRFVTQDRHSFTGREKI